MSKENMEKFVAQLKTDSALAEKMMQIQVRYVKSLAALARESGYDLAEENISKNEQLSEEELARAAGGLSRYKLDVRDDHRASQEVQLVLPDDFEPPISDDEFMKLLFDERRLRK